MEIIFSKSGQSWVSEFQVSGDFNLHVERSKGDVFSVYQRTSQSGEYAYVEGIGTQTGKKVIEFDFTGAIYPKYIKVVCGTKPTMAVVTVNE
jgi:hypothetical protein